MTEGTPLLSSVEDDGPDNAGRQSPHTQSTEIFTDVFTPKRNYNFTNWNCYRFGGLPHKDYDVSVH